MLFQLVPGGFSYLINQNNYNSNQKKISGFRNMQEKLEKKKTEEMQFSSCDIFFWLNPNLEGMQLEQLDQILVLRISKA